MFTIRCPECGAPVRVSLASPERIRCRHCGYDGPPPAEHVEKLRAAARLVGSLDRRQRQFSIVRRMAARSGPWQVLAIAALAWPLLLTGLISFIVVHKLGGRDVAEAASRLNLGVTAALMLLGILILVVKHRRLRRACAALPPPAPGEPAECFLCGAPLLTSARGVARCGYCHSDNVVEAGALSRTQRKVHEGLDNIEARVRARAKAARSTMVWLVAALATMAVLAPVLLGFALSMLNDRAKELPARYVEWPWEGTRCFGRIHTDLWGRQWVGSSMHRFWSQSERYDPQKGSKLLKPSQLVGRAVLTPVGDVAKIVSVQEGGPYSDALLTLQSKAGRHQRAALKTCLAQEPRSRRLARIRAAGLRTDMPPTQLALTAEQVVFGVGQSVFIVRRDNGRVTVLTLEGWIRQVQVHGGDLYVLSGSQIRRVAGFASIERPPATTEPPKRDDSAHASTLVASCRDGVSQFALDRGRLYYVDESGAIARQALTDDKPEKLFQADRAATRVAVDKSWVYWADHRRLYRGDKRGRGKPVELGQFGERLTGSWLYVTAAHVYGQAKFRIVRVPKGGGEAEAWLPVMPESVVAWSHSTMVWAGGSPWISPEQPGFDEGVRVVVALDPQRRQLPGPHVEDVLAVGLAKDTVAWLARAPWREGKIANPLIVVERKLR